MFLRLSVLVLGIALCMAHNGECNEGGWGVETVAESLRSETAQQPEQVQEPIPDEQQQIGEEPPLEPPVQPPVQPPIVPPPVKGGQTRFFAESVRNPVIYTVSRSQAARALNLPAQADTVLPGINSQFSCDQLPYGYYADVSNNCQIYHICQPTLANGVQIMQRFSFFCPPGTLFDQVRHVCMSQTASDLTPCSLATRYFSQTVRRFSSPIQTPFASASVMRASVASGKTVAPIRGPGLPPIPEEDISQPIQQVQQPELPLPPVQQPELPPVQQPELPPTGGVKGTRSQVVLPPVQQQEELPLPEQQQLPTNQILPIREAVAKGQAPLRAEPIIQQTEVPLPQQPEQQPEPIVEPPQGKGTRSFAQQQVLPLRSTAPAKGVPAPLPSRSQEWPLPIQTPVQEPQIIEPLPTNTFFRKGSRYTGF